MKRLILFLVIVGVILAIPIAVMASDISNAQWLTKVVVTNNSTAASAVSANFTLDTDDMISACILNDTASDCAMLLNGLDTKFMPGLPGYPWIVFLESMAADSTQELDLYSGNVTGGEIAIFHDGTGLTIADDDADFEFGDNFAINFHARIDTSMVGYDLFGKDSAYTSNITGSGNITFTIFGGLV